MARPILLQDSWSLGCKQDPPREQLPKGACWNLVDYIPEFGAPLVKRGGWSRPFDVLAAGTYVAGIGFAGFTAGAQVLAINDAGTLYTMSPGTATVTSRGASRVPAHAPTFYKNTAIICDINGAAVPYTWDRTTLAALTGSPPNFTVSCTYKDHLVGARSATNLNRVWFASAGTLTGWVTTDPGGQWLDATHPVFGLGALRNMIVVFSEGFTERIVGDVIPGISGSDMRVEPLHAVGCADPGAIAVTDDYIVYANADGVYVTDGVALSDLTVEGGIKALWQSLLAGYGSTWTIAGTMHRGRYIVSVLDGATFKCAFMCEVKRRVWTRLSNVKALMMVNTPVGIPGAAPSVYFADRASLYVGDLGTMFTPSATYKNDGDGTAVTPTVETSFFFGRQGRKRWRKLHVGHYMTDAATDNPALTVSIAEDLATGSYTALTDTLAETTLREREELDVRVASEGIAVKIAQTNASAVTQLYSLEAETMTSEPSRS